MLSKCLVRIISRLRCVVNSAAMTLRNDRKKREPTFSRNTLGIGGVVLRKRKKSEPRYRWHGASFIVPLAGHCPTPAVRGQAPQPLRHERRRLGRDPDESWGPQGVLDILGNGRRPSRPNSPSSAKVVSCPRNQKKADNSSSYRPLLFWLRVPTQSGQYFRSKAV